MLSPVEMIAAVGEWSDFNFGKNPYALQVPPMPGDEWVKHQIVFLNELCPLMGMVEEYGELLDGMESEINSVEMVLDAAGDFGIYLSDYCRRSGIVFETWNPHKDWKNALYTTIERGIGANLGKLYHAHLKRIQKIRKMDQPEIFAEKQRAAVRGMIASMSQLCHYRYSCDWWVIVNKTWEEIVKKRDWKTNPKTGVEETENETRNDPVEKPDAGNV